MKKKQGGMAFLLSCGLRFPSKHLPVSKSTIESPKKVVKYVPLTIMTPEPGQRRSFSVFVVNSAHFQFFSRISIAGTEQLNACWITCQ